MALLACSSPSAPQQEELWIPPKPPRDIVLVSVDTLRADRMSLYGYERETTPRIEAIAAQARVFDRAIAPAPWTLPSMVSLFTGLLPSQHGVTSRASELAPQATTLAEKMTELGYETAFFGVNAAFVTGHGMEQGFETWRPFDGLSGGQLNREVDAFLDAREDPRPLFLVVHYFEPHCPYRATRDMQALWMPEGGEPEPLPQQQFEALGDCFKVQIDGESVNDLRVIQARYDQEVLLTDQLVGELYERVQGMEPHFGLVADHGEAFWEHGVHGHGLQLYEEQVRVPMFLRLAHIDTPLRVERAESTLWMHDTLVGLAGGENLRMAQSRPRTESGYAGVDLRAIYGGTYKIVLDRASGQTQAFDLYEDPLEQHPLETTSTQRSQIEDWPEPQLGLSKQRGQTERERQGLQELGYLE